MLLREERGELTGSPSPRVGLPSSGGQTQSTGVFVCVCMCLCMREGDREREGGFKVNKFKVLSVI